MKQVSQEKYGVPAMVEEILMRRNKCRDCMMREA
jgi:hypothetical protein